MESKANSKPNTTKRKMVRVQVPLPEGLKEQAEAKAHELGFGSMQEVVRLFLAGFVKGKYSIGFSSQPERPDNAA